MSDERLDRVRCGYCNRRAHAVEWEGDARVPVCKGHAVSNCAEKPEVT